MNSAICQSRIKRWCEECEVDHIEVIEYNVLFIHYDDLVELTHTMIKINKTNTYKLN